MKRVNVLYTNYTPTLTFRVYETQNTNRDSKERGREKATQQNVKKKHGHKNRIKN